MTRGSSRLSVLDARWLEGSESERRSFVEQLREASRDLGSFHLIGHSVPITLCARVLSDARAFFALPPEDKELIDIQRSRHARGYSKMSNDRDWREQVHLGLELPEVVADREAPSYWRLQGPNLWPGQLGAEWRDTMLSFLSEIDATGRRLMSALAKAIGSPPGYFDDKAGDAPYLLMKLIFYYPQPSGQSTRSGVAGHCDWSWLTFLLQDAPGLQVQSRAGEWLDVPLLEGALVVSLGELTEILTSGIFRATPHRVHNLSRERPRISVPVFMNPSLRAEIAPPPEGPVTRSSEPVHVHRVVNPAEPVAPFVFGESEWRRKGLGRWCYAEGCLAAG